VADGETEMRINLSGRPGKIAFFYYILPVLRGLLVVTFFFLGMLRTFEESINLRSTGALPPIHPITHLLTFSDVLQIILGLVIIGLVYSKKLPKIMAIYPVYFIIWQMLLIFVFPKAITNYCFSVSFANYPLYYHVIPSYSPLEISRNQE